MSDQGDELPFWTVHGPVLAEHRRPSPAERESVWLWKAKPRRLVGWWLHFDNGHVSAGVEHRRSRGTECLNGQPLEDVIEHAVRVHGPLITTASSN